MSNTINADDCIKFLNELAKIDKKAIAELLFTRADCNEKLCNHPTVQVTQDNKVGLLGILNGLFGKSKEGYGHIATIYDTETDNLEFINYGRFRKNNK